MIKYRDAEPIMYLPRNLHTPHMTALSYACKMAMSKMLEYQKQIRILADIDGLKEDILDLVALELNTQYYDRSLSIDQKRELIKRTLIWYEKGGTVSAVQEMIDILFDDGQVVEWDKFSDGKGEPGEFEIVTSMEITGETIRRFTEVIERVKRLTAHLRALRIQGSFEWIIQYDFGIRMLIDWGPRGIARYLDGKWKLDGTALLNGLYGGTEMEAAAGNGKITLKNSLYGPVQSMTLYGMSETAGTPQKPAEIETTGKKEAIIMTSKGLAGESSRASIGIDGGITGIPVERGGSHTDAAEQQWISDEADLTGGKLIRRIGRYSFNGSTFTENGAVKDIAPEEEIEIILEILRDERGEESAEETATYLSEHPIEVYQNLEKETEGSLPGETLEEYANLVAYNGTTTITADQMVYMEADYIYPIDVLDDYPVTDILQEIHHQVVIEYASGLSDFLFGVPVSLDTGQQIGITISDDREEKTVNDSGDAVLRRGLAGKIISLRISGKSGTDGTPADPKAIQSSGSSGNLTVTVSGNGDSDQAVITAAGGLAGIPVERGGSHTDANGQQWISDEADLTGGKLIRRVGRYTFDGTEFKENGTAQDIAPEEEIEIILELLRAERGEESAEETAAYLAAHPIEAYQNLAEPEETAGAAAELPVYDGITHITINEPEKELAPGIDAVYVGERHIEIGYDADINVAAEAAYNLSQEASIYKDLRLEGTRLLDGTWVLDAGDMAI